MSSAGQIVGGIVGAVIGFYVGGPVGAFQGAALGAGIGGVLDPPKGPTVEGPKLQDKGVQTSTYGASIPRIYGIIGGAGNITQLENNKLRERVTKEESGGKGGSSSTTTKLYTYSATFQLSLCEGPIAGVRRIWCGDKLIYNAGSDDLETIMASNQAAEGFRVYLGTDDQMPDPRYEAEYGVGNVSAHRGEAYIAFYDFQLADYSNTLQGAQFKVEVCQVFTPTAPSLMNSYELSDIQPEYTDLYQTAGLYSDSSGSLSLYRATNSTNAQLWKSSSTSFRMDGDPFLAGDNPYMLGVSDVESVALAGTGSFTISDGSAVPISTWTLEGVNFTSARSRLHVRGGDEYLCNTEASTTNIYLKQTDNVSVPAIVSTTTSLSPRGQIHDICVTDSRIFAISKSKQLTCYDHSFVEQWNVDMSAADFSADLFTGSVAVIRSAGGDRIVLRSLDKFWRIDSSGYDYLGQAAGFVLGDERNTSDHLIGGLWIHFSNSIQTIHYINVDVIVAPSTDLAEVIKQECLKSALLSISDVDTSLLPGLVRGYRVSGGSIRSAIEPLQAAFPFDVRQHGYQIQFLPRGQSSIVTIPWEDLGATDGDQSLDIIQQSREMDSQLPARTTIKYLDASREYAIAEQYSERLNTEAINRVDRQLPLVLTANEAAGVSEVLNFLPWLERTDAAFTLPPTYRYLESGDIVTVETQDATYELRISEINEMPSGLLQVKAKPNRAALYSSSATGSEGVPPTGNIALGGPSIFLPLDIPVVDETIQNAVGFIGVMTGITTGWPGALAVRSNDGGQTWTDIQAFQGKATIGLARESLASSTSTMIDQSALTVDLFSGTLESITKDQMLSGINYAAYGKDGRWEIIRFQNAVLQVDGSYLVSHFMRGERGTEWATGLHASFDYFVLLDDPDNMFIGSPVEAIALERLYRGVTSGASIDTASDVPFTYQGVNLECLSPVYARGTRDGSSNFTGTFTRRSRLSSSWWTTGTEAPVGEATQEYEIDVMNGSAVERTITAVTPTFSYSAADQTTDFGSPQASITFRIYQLSGTVGRGYPYEVTL